MSDTIQTRDDDRERAKELGASPGESYRSGKVKHDKNKHSAARAPSATSEVVRVRVYNAHREYFDTEIDVNMSLRPVQQAIEEYFKVKSELQLILHNRRQVDPQRSLSENGCVLLPGDPYIKLVFTLKRGALLNIVFQLNGSNTSDSPATSHLENSLPLACHELATLYEVKQQLCEELRRRRLLRSRVHSEQWEDSVNQSRNRGMLSICPQRMRLMWRYSELNDKATLHYYHIQTNSVLQVRWRRASDAPSQSSNGGESSSNAVLAPDNIRQDQNDDKARTIRPKHRRDGAPRHFVQIRPLLHASCANSAPQSMNILENKEDLNETDRKTGKQQDTAFDTERLAIASDSYGRDDADIGSHLYTSPAASGNGMHHSHQTVIEPAQSRSEHHIPHDVNYRRPQNHDFQPHTQGHDRYNMLTNMNFAATPRIDKTYTINNSKRSEQQIDTYGIHAVQNDGPYNDPVYSMHSTTDLVSIRLAIQSLEEQVNLMHSQLIEKDRYVQVHNALVLQRNDSLCKRISELERNIIHFQHFLQRALDIVQQSTDT